tara:strand:+ start:221 stop:586 length:366 start_codon:yes stop_codon:yes gene_type:complete
MMPKTLIIIFSLTLITACGGQSGGKLANKFWIDCDGGLLIDKWVVKFDRLNKLAEMKSPYFVNNLKICLDNDDEIVVSRDCYNQEELKFNFNKWDGTFGHETNLLRSNECKVNITSMKKYD